MKLIEKLASEWWLQNHDLNDKGEGTFSNTEAFEAGFRKAREMASTTISSIRVADKYSQPDGPDTILALHALSTVWRILQNLAEEEVK